MTSAVGVSLPAPKDGEQLTESQALHYPFWLGPHRLICPVVLWWRQGEKGSALHALVVVVVCHQNQHRNEFWAYRCQLDPQWGSRGPEVGQAAAGDPFRGGLLHPLARDQRGQLHHQGPPGC